MSTASMQVLPASLIKAWDAFSMAEEAISESALMERAARQAALSIMSHIPKSRPVTILCGPGNNGADGLVIGGVLAHNSYRVRAITCTFGLRLSPLFVQQQAGLNKIHPGISTELTDVSDFESVYLSSNKNGAVVDALFGISARPGLPAHFLQIIRATNHWRSLVRERGIHLIAIDLPSGLFADFSAGVPSDVIDADLTLTFQCFRQSFLLPSTGKYCGQLEVLDIGLSSLYLQKLQSANEIGCKLISLEMCRQIYKPRKPFSHKGTYGHSLIIAGSRQKGGAAVLSARGCLHAGTGLLSLLVPESIRSLLLSCVPEAMTVPSSNDDFLVSDALPEGKFSAIGMGPGLGEDPGTARFVKQTLSESKIPLIIDADALNLLALEPEWWTMVPAGSILSPHPGEFDRLAGDSANDWHRIQKQVELSKKCRSVIILKGFRTSVAFPNGSLYFNTSGNAGMATGGSGDTLTGILTALRAQGYTSEDSALMGVFIHGMAGDLCAKAHGMTALSAGMLSDYLGTAFMRLEN